MIPHQLKRTIISAADFCGIARMFRHINRKKLLVVMYHGVTTNEYTPPIWTQLPLKKFRRQLEFLREHYLPVSLTEVMAATRGGSPLPERAVLVTFDDGLKNNYSVAFPLLQELNVPAVIFLTVGLIGSKEILWFDELYFLLLEAVTLGTTPDLPNERACDLLQNGQVWESYQITVENLKRAGLKERTRQMAKLRSEVPLDHHRLLNDFGLLDWDEIRTMYSSGLAEFGVHTASHRILAELADDEWEREIIIPKQILEQELDIEAAAFCFPNGKPLVDFHQDQIQQLQKAGFHCAFTTENSLFDRSYGNGMTIGRVPAGNDATSDTAYFPLNASGALHFARDLARRMRISMSSAGVQS